MKIEHMIIGSSDLEASVKFYEDLLDYKVTEDNSFTGAGRTLESDDSDILILPFEKEKLPNPFHFAFEAKSKDEFDKIYNKAIDMKLEPRVLPQRDSDRGIGMLRKVNGKEYDIFYVFDPGQVNIEIMYPRN